MSPATYLYSKGVGDGGEIAAVPIVPAEKSSLMDTTLSKSVFCYKEWVHSRASMSVRELKAESMVTLQAN